MKALSLPRLLILTIGPFAVVTIAYLAAAPQASSATARGSSAMAQKSALLPAQTEAQSLADRCQAAAADLRRRLPAGFEIIVRGPFVLAGNLGKSHLQSLHADVVAPVSRALNATYFERSPRHPILIVVCSSEGLFQRLAKDWDGHLDPGYHGYYQRDKHRILLDLEAGNGSLAHELTHALSQADCEHLPEWFDEGLGALHEEATYAAGGKQLIGLPNWRCQLTKQAVRTGKLPAFSALANSQTFRSNDVGQHYAVARSLCLFLQDKDLLTTYYKALRTRPRSDAQGIASLCKVLRVDSEAEVRRQFIAWVNRK